MDVPLKEEAQWQMKDQISMSFSFFPLFVRKKKISIYAHTSDISRREQRQIRKRELLSLKDEI
jgi:hypothetical protein